MSEQALDEKTELDLWLTYKKNRDPKIRESFIKQYAPLVRYVAGKVAMGLPQNVDYDDLVGYGVFGLIDAIDKFDPEKHVKFKTYAVTRIRGSIFDELRATDWVPRSVRQKSREVDEAILHLESKLGRSATDKEVAQHMGVSESDYNETIMKISGTSVLSLNDVWYSGDDSDKVSIVDSIESPTALNPDHIVEREEIKKVIVEALSDLPDKEKKVLILYYYEDLTLKEIGKVLEVTESRVSQLHTKAIARLRARLTNMKKGIM
ncbi:MAG: RNA polymerase sigma factor WhiG [Spirochaetes bacterium GWB1_48_6]|nr:MAG: RNA polymerase sigma factor WhiG [Spirochaetes bacterium GWB1_48_6]